MIWNFVRKTEKLQQPNESPANPSSMSVSKNLPLQSLDWSIHI